MNKQLKKYLTIGLIVLAAILSLPIISTLSNNDGLASDAPSLIAQGPNQNSHQQKDKTHPRDNNDPQIGEGNSWGG